MTARASASPSPAADRVRRYAELVVRAGCDAGPLRGRPPVALLDAIREARARRTAAWTIAAFPVGAWAAQVYGRTIAVLRDDVWQLGGPGT